MMNLYYNVGAFEKLFLLKNEMEEKGIHHDQFTVSVLIKAYISVSDADGVENVVKLMESDPGITPDWNLYTDAANGYLKVGSIDKALERMRKMELVMEKRVKGDLGVVILLQLCAKTGRKDELYRIWNNYKEKNKVCNDVYRCVISLLMNLGNFDGVESVFTQWDNGSTYDLRVVDHIIDLNCRKGNLEKAEALLNRGTSLGSNPLFSTWCHMAGGYIMESDLSKAIGSLKKAVSVTRFASTCLKTVQSCLKYLEEGNDLDEFVRSLNPRYFPSASVVDKLVCFIETGKLPFHSKPAADRR